MKGPMKAFKAEVVVMLPADIDDKAAQNSIGYALNLGAAVMSPILPPGIRIERPYVMMVELKEIV